MQPRSPAAKLFLSALWGLVQNEHSSLTAALARLLTTPRLTPLQTPFSLWHPADRLALIQARSGLLQTPKYPFSSEQSSEGRAEVKSARYYRANTRSYCSCCFSAVNFQLSSFTLVSSKVKLENQENGFISLLATKNPLHSYIKINATL